MISDLIPRRDWTDEFGNRAFWFDAFLSHNREDESDALVDRLRAEGARIASDHEGPPEGWPFPTSLFAQLRTSRFIIVSVGQTFRLSPWIRSELKVAHRLQTESGIDRIVLALLGNYSVPRELERHAVFDVSHEEGCRDLANHIVKLNQLPAEMLNVRSKLKRETDQSQLTEDAGRLSAKLGAIDDNDPWYIAADMLVDDTGHPGFTLQGNLPMIVVSKVENSEAPLTAAFGNEMVAVMRGMLAVAECNGDQRDWLLRLLIRAACGKPDYWDDFLNCIAAEPHDAVARDLLPRVRRAGGPTGHDPRIAMAVLVCGRISGMYKADREHLSAGLPDVVLARLQVQSQANIDLTELSYGERINIAFTELPRHLDSGGMLEVWFRNLVELVAKPSPAATRWPWEPRDTEQSTLIISTMALSSIDWSMAYSRFRGGEPLIGAIPEPSIVPILVSALQLPQLADYARGVGERLQMFYSEQARRDDRPEYIADESDLFRDILSAFPMPEDTQGVLVDLTAVINSRCRSAGWAQMASVLSQKWLC